MAFVFFGMRVIKVVDSSGSSHLNEILEKTLPNLECIPTFLEKNHGKIIRTWALSCPMEKTASSISSYEKGLPNHELAPEIEICRTNWRTMPMISVLSSTLP